MIDRIRLTAAAKIQLSTLKRKTGIEHYNSICRHALCISLANPSMPPEEEFNFNGGVEIDWRTFSGGNDTIYLSLLLLRIKENGSGTDVDSIKRVCASHLHRGLSYMMSQTNLDDFFASLVIGAPVE